LIFTFIIIIIIIISVHYLLQSLIK